jgi:ABC-2 type transport system permease protein
VTSLRQLWVIVSYELRSRRRSLIIWGVALGALGALYVALYPAMSDMLNEYIKDAGESMKQFMGGLDGPITIEQFLDMELMGGIIPMALPFLTMLIGARTIAGNEERKTLDLLLSNPLPRRQVVTGAVLTMAIGTACVLAITWVLTYIAAPIAGVDLAPGRLAAGLATLWPFCLVFGALTLLLSSLMRRAALTTVTSAVVLAVMYVISALADVSKSVEPFRVVSLFYHLGRPLEGDFPWTAVLAMLAGVCVLTGGAIALFARRDIYT